MHLITEHNSSGAPLRPRLVTLAEKADAALVSAVRGLRSRERPSVA